MSTEGISLEQISSLLDEKLNPILEELESLKKDNNALQEKINAIGTYSKRNCDTSKALSTDSKNLIKFNKHLYENINSLKTELSNSFTASKKSISSKGRAPSGSNADAIDTVDKFWDSLSSEEKSKLPYTDKATCKRKIGAKDKGKICDKVVIEQGATDEDGNSIPDAHFCEACKKLKISLKLLKDMMGVTNTRKKTSDVTKSVNNKATSFKEPKKVKTEFYLDDDEHGELFIHKASGFVCNSENIVLFKVDDDDERIDLNTTDIMKAVKLGFKSKKSKIKPSSNSKSISSLNKTFGGLNKKAGNKTVLDRVSNSKLKTPSLNLKPSIGTNRLKPFGTATRKPMSIDSIEEEDEKDNSNDSEELSFGEDDDSDNFDLDDI